MTPFPPIFLPAQGVCKLPGYPHHRRIDIWCYPRHQLAPVLIQFTGDTPFNRALRLRAKYMCGDRIPGLVQRATQAARESAVRLVAAGRGRCASASLLDAAAVRPFVTLKLDSGHLVPLVRPPAAELLRPAYSFAHPSLWSLWSIFLGLASSARRADDP